MSPQVSEGLNAYSYVRNSPLSFTDPSGFQADDEIELPLDATSATEIIFDEEPDLLYGSSGFAPSGYLGDGIGIPVVNSTQYGSVTSGQGVRGGPDITPNWGLDLSIPTGGPDITPNWGLDFSQQLVTGGPDITPNWGLDLSGGQTKTPNPEVFLWYAREAKLESETRINKVLKGSKLQLEVSGELILIAGLNAKGPFEAAVEAAGGSIGVKRGFKGAAYAGLFGGRESVTQHAWGTGQCTREIEPDILVEGGFGSPGAQTVVGAYQTGYSSSAGNTGSYFGFRIGSYSFGVGANLDFMLLAVPEANPEFGPIYFDF
jgi:hypothetical protein